MEIIYLVLMIFAEGNMQSISIDAWHTYKGAPAALTNRSCDDAIRDQRFQAHVASKLPDGSEGRLACKTAREMNDLTALVGAAESMPVVTKNDPRLRPEILSGKLVHKPYDPHRKSAAAYLAQEFFLEVAGKGRLALYPTDDVDRDVLLKLQGKNIKIRGQFVDRTPHYDPETPAQYPIDEDGGPLKRLGYEVLEILP